MKKKITLGLSALLLSTNLYAGDYDGYWQYDLAGTIGGGDYVSIIQKGDTVIYVEFLLNPTTRQPLEWNAQVGDIVGNKVTMKTLIAPPSSAPGCTVGSTLTFASPAQGTLEIASVAGTCPAGATTLVGSKANLRKVF